MDPIYPPRESKVYVVKEELDFLKSNGQANFPTTKEEVRLMCQMKASDFYDLAEEVENIVIEDYQVVDQVVRMEETPEQLESLPSVFANLSEEALELHTIEKLKNLAFRKKLFEKKSDDRRKFTPLLNKLPTTSFIDLEIYSEILLIFRFYEPFRHTSDRRVHPPKFHQQFTVFGSQFLTELRDKIFCRANSGPFKDISESPFDIPEDEEEEAEAKLSIEEEVILDPGFFFIHDTFYNDNRLNNPDYSQIIIDWSKDHLDSADFKSQLMEETKFMDLKLRIGHPYVYQHKGNCEHVFAITSMHLLTKSDCLTRSEYPILSNVSQNRITVCSLCGLSEIEYVVKECKQHVTDPVSLCANCLKSFHYVDGKKIGDFKCYRFFNVRPN